ncbi:MAG: S8 family serine peptidase [Eubacteriales bacterium]|nr:S8 family serine peptidase [Eubacteriales bacterium]
MKRIVSFVLLFVLILSAVPLTVFASDTVTTATENDPVEAKIISTANINEDFEPDSIIVVLNNAASKELKDYTATDFSEVGAVSVENLTKYTTEKVERQRSKVDTLSVTEEKLKAEDEFYIDEDDYHQFWVVNLNKSSKQNVLKCIKILEQRDDVISVSPNYYSEEHVVISTVDEVVATIDEYISEGDSTPNDTSYSSQWAPAKINLPSAWNITTGSSSVKVGVIDSGIQGTHPDLKNRVNTTLSKDFTGSGNALTDLSGHGTHVAGIIGAQGNNSTGVTGVCWNVSLVSLKAGLYDSDTGKCTMNATRFVSALDYAQANGIPIVNVSYGGGSILSSERTSLLSYSGLVVCSAGNDGEDTTDVGASYYGYNTSNMLAVASTTSADVLSSFSNYCTKYVELAAPGSSIYSTDIGSTYTSKNGTSMAAPYVAGVAALLKSKYPSMTATAMRYYIMSGVDKLSSLSGKVETGGRLNAYKALTGVKTFTVKYNKNGGDGSMSDTTVIYNSSTKLRANQFTNNGAEFVGWTAKRSSDSKWYYTNGTSTGWYLEGSQPSGYEKYVYSDKQSVSRTSSVNGDVVTMYAQWKILYTIKFNNNNGTGSMSDMSVEYGVPFQLTANSFTRSRCTFDHWYAKNQDGETYCVGANGAGWYVLNERPDGYVRKEFSNRSYIYDYTMQGVTQGDVITMYAYWEPTAAELGDVNMNGNVSIADATLIQKYVSALATLTADQLVIADVNYSGTVTTKDATAIQKYVAGTQDYLMQ